MLAAGSREERFLAEFDDAVARIGVVAVAAYAREGGIGFYGSTIYVLDSGELYPTPGNTRVEKWTE